MADSQSKKKKGVGSRLKNIFRRKDKSKPKPGAVTASSAPTDLGSTMEQTVVDQRSSPAGHAGSGPRPVEAADQKQKVVHGGGAAPEAKTPVVSPSPAPVVAVKDQGGRETVQKVKHEAGGTAVDATADGADAGGGKTATGADVGGGKTAAGADAGGGKTATIDKKTGFRDVAVPRQATKECKAAEAGLVGKALETLDPGSTQVGKVVEEGERSSGQAPKKTPHDERALDSANAKASPSAIREGGEKPPTPISPVSQGRTAQGAGPGTSPASRTQAPAKTGTVGHEPPSHGKTEPGGNILERVIAKGEVPSSAFADAPADKPSARDSGIAIPQGGDKRATLSTGGVQIPTPVGTVQGAESRGMELPGGDVIPTPVDAQGLASRKPPTQDSIPTPGGVAERAGNNLLPDRDPKQAPPLVSNGRATGAPDTKSAAEKAAATVLGVGSVPGDKLPSGDEPAGQLQEDAPGAGVLETLKSYVPGLGGAKAGELAAPLGAEGTGEGRSDSHSGQAGDDAASQGGVFGAGGQAGERRVGEASRAGDFGPVPGHAVTYEAALAGEHRGGVLTIAGVSIDVGGMLRLGWEMLLEAIVLVAACALGIVPWLRGEQATIIDMDHLDDLWHNWFGPGRTPSAPITSQEDRT